MARQSGHRRVAQTLAAGAVAVDGLTLSSGQLLLPDGLTSAPSLSFASDPSTGIAFILGNLGQFVGGARKFLVNSGGAACQDDELYMGAQAIRMVERSDPTAPAANQLRLYAKDSGAGKTQLVARFNTGAVQAPASEP